MTKPAARDIKEEGDWKKVTTRAKLLLSNVSMTESQLLIHDAIQWELLKQVHTNHGLKIITVHTTRKDHYAVHYLE